ncbi:hypothetical protein TNCV_675351 [Trichonephila clavipes]|nr:hypothetical protein TNCV_675351 [Trichonephila clavipes]
MEVSSSAFTPSTLLGKQDDEGATSEEVTQVVILGASQPYFMDSRSFRSQSRSIRQSPEPFGGALSSIEMNVEPTALVKSMIENDESASQVCWFKKYSEVSGGEIRGIYKRACGNTVDFAFSPRPCLKPVLTNRHRNLHVFSGAGSLRTSRAYVVFDNFPVISEISMTLKSLRSL